MKLATKKQIKKGDKVVLTKWKDNRVRTVEFRRGNDVFLERGSYGLQVKLGDIKLAKSSDIMREKGKRKIGGKTYDKIDHASSKSEAKMKADRYRRQFKSVRVIKNAPFVYLIYARA